MLVKELMTKNVTTVNPKQMVSDVAKLMEHYGIGAIPICEGKILTGMITDRDVAIRVIANDLNPTTTAVRDVTLDQISYCFEDQEIEDAAKKMEDAKVRRLPVVDRNKNLVGIVSLRDLALKSYKKRPSLEVLQEVSKPAAPAA
jgi:CBS domain-containing protein